MSVARTRRCRPRAAPRKPKAAGIVSSSHLVSAKSVELSELEFGLIVAWNAFSRWAMRCMAAAGCPELTITDVLVLHHICHRARNKKLGDICFVLNVEDTHVVGYSLKKLLAAGLAQGEKRRQGSVLQPDRGGRGGGGEVPRGARGLPDRQPRRRAQRRHRRERAPAAHDVGPVRPGGARGDVAVTRPALGVVMLDTRFPRLPGDIGNPRDLRVPGALPHRRAAPRRAGW